MGSMLRSVWGDAHAAIRRSPHRVLAHQGRAVWTDADGAPVVGADGKVSAIEPPVAPRGAPGVRSLRLHLLYDDIRLRLAADLACIGFPSLSLPEIRARMDITAAPAPRT